MESTTLEICRLLISTDTVECEQISPTANSSRAIAYVPTDYDTEQQGANAEFIVQACNSFDELLAALKLTLSGFTYDPGHSDLDDEQPISVRMTLGDWLKMNMLKYRAEGK